MARRKNAGRPIVRIAAGAVALAAALALAWPASVNGDADHFQDAPEVIPVPTARLPMAGPRIFTPREYLYFLDPDLAPILDRVIRCESGWKPAIKNASSTASGLAQFLNGTWRTTRRRMGEPDDDLSLKHDPFVHLETTVWLARHDGIMTHWAESAGCWRRT